MKIADTHTHLYFESFDEDRDKVLTRNRTNGVELQIQIGCDEISSLVALDLAKKNDDMKCTLGLHPVDVWNFVNNLEPRRYSGYEDYALEGTTIDLFIDWVEKIYLQNQEHVVGFGETGIDLYHHNTEDLLEQQLYSFKKHIELCKKYDKTLVIHSRNATEKTLKFLQENIKKGETKGIWHCFSENADIALQILNEFDFYLGFGGVATYKNSEAIREAILITPLNRIITETDAPFLVPNQKRKTEKRNEPYFLTEVIELIAEIKKMPVEEISTILFANAKKAYGLS